MNLVLLGIEVDLASPMPYGESPAWFWEAWPKRGNMSVSDETNLDHLALRRSICALCVSSRLKLASSSPFLGFVISFADVIIGQFLRAMDVDRCESRKQQSERKTKSARKRGEERERRDTKKTKQKEEKKLTVST